MCCLSYPLYPASGAAAREGQARHCHRLGAGVRIARRRGPHNWGCASMRLAAVYLYGSRGRMSLRERGGWARRCLPPPSPVPPCATRAASGT